MQLKGKRLDNEEFRKCVGERPGGDNLGRQPEINLSRYCLLKGLFTISQCLSSKKKLLMHITMVLLFLLRMDTQGEMDKIINTYKDQITEPAGLASFVSELTLSASGLASFVGRLASLALKLSTRAGG